VGIAANDANAFQLSAWPNVDDSVSLDLHSKVEVKLPHGMTVGAGYKYQQWNYSDFSLDGQRAVATLSNGNFNNLITMNALPTSYTVQTVMVTLNQEF
jgi:opacity protein-like surface antigen